jgi:hypothetical protein
MPSSPQKGAGKKGRDFYAMLGVDKTANQGHFTHLTYDRNKISCATY